VLLAGYGHFIRVATRQRWDEQALDLTRDAEVWPGLPEARRRPLSVLVAGFCLGETAVADELEPFALSGGCAERSACFRAQAADEARHARFFDRVAAEVLRVPGRSAAERRAALRPLLEPEYCELFEVRLPEVARRLGGDRGGLADAVGLYHMVLEGLVFTAGQLTILELLDAVELPGLRRGLGLVLRDERWHLGFGARTLQDLGLDEPALDRLLGADVTALRAWGHVVDDATAARVARIHRRRLSAAGLTSPTVATVPDAAGLATTPRG
jgi:ribonucleoside-diphosphate reductase beta chain